MKNQNHKGRNNFQKSFRHRKKTFTENMTICLLNYEKDIFTHIAT